MTERSTAPLLGPAIVGGCTLVKPELLDYETRTFLVLRLTGTVGE